MGRLKNKTKKQNVLVMSVLGLTLLIVSLLLIFSGAYLTEEVGNEVSVTSGNYELSGELFGEELLDEDEIPLPGPMKPGDSQVFTIEYQNTGNITGDLNVEISAKTLGLNEFKNEVSIYHNKELVVNSPNEKGFITIEKVDAGETKSINIRIELSPTGSDQLRLPQKLEVNVNANLKSNSGVWTSNIINTKTSVMYGGYSNSLYEYKENPNGTSYTVNGFDTIYIENYKNGVQPTDITIPETYKDKTVNAIGTSAFEGKYLKSVQLPNSLITIENRAFFETGLTNINLPDGITKIGAFAFYNNDLTSINLGTSLSTIGRAAFRHNKLQTVSIPSALKNINKEVFRNNKIIVVNFEEGLRTIGIQSFANNLIEEVVIPETTNKTTIQSEAFKSNQIKQLTLPDSVSTIGDNAFAAQTPSGDSRLVIANLADRDEVGPPPKLRGYQFNNEWKILVNDNEFFNYGSRTVEGKQVMVVDGFNVDKINDVYGEGFVIKDIVIPTMDPDGNAITQIADGANFSYKGLETIIIPEGITVIGNFAFTHNQIKEIIIPSTVTKIGQNSFQGNKLLTYVEIPDSVISIGEKAFNPGYEETPIPRVVRANLLDGDLIGPPPTLRGYTADDGLWTLQLLKGKFSRQSNTDELEDGVILEDDIAPEVEVVPDDSTEETPEVDTDVIPEEKAEDTPENETLESDVIPEEETEVIPETEPPKTPEETLDLEDDDETLDDNREISDDKEIEVDLKAEDLDAEEPIEDEPSDIPEVKDK